MKSSDKIHLTPNPSLRRGEGLSESENSPLYTVERGPGGEVLGVTKTEWRAVLIFAVVVMALTTLPYLAGAAAQRPGWRFGWFLFGVTDGNSYLAKMREGAVGDWLFHIVYTSEPHDGAFLFTPYLAGGKLAALFVSPSSPAFVDAMLIVFHASRIGFGVLLILVTYRFIAVFVIRRSVRWLALILVCLGGGFGWLLTLLGKGYWLNSYPIDTILPEGYTFYLLYGLPHLALARAALLDGFLLTFRALALDGVRQWLPWALLAGLCWLIMGLCVPFYIAVLYAILGVWGVAALIRFRRFPVGLFWRCLAGALIPTPLFVYNLVVFATNPVLGAWSSQNVLPSPHPLHYVFGYGLLVFLAIPAIRWAWRRGRRQGNTAYLLIVAWVLAGPVLAYLPITVQRRLLEGIFVPLCILAAVGLRLWLLWLNSISRRVRLSWRVAALTVIALTVPTNLILPLSAVAAVRWYDPRNVLLHSELQIAALDWLNTHAPADSVVLSDFDTGNYLPARASVRVFIGHGPETICLDIQSNPRCTVGKRDLTNRLFAGQMSADERRALYTTYNIRYVIFPGGGASPGWPELQPVYDTDGYRIYQVNPA